MDRLRETALVAAGIPIVCVLLLIAAWAVDTSAGSAKVKRNVQIIDQDVGRMNPEQVAETLATMDSRFAAIPIEIKGGGEQPTVLDAGSIGATIDVTATVEAAVNVGADDPFALRPFQWMGSFFRKRTSPLHMAAGAAEAAAALQPFADELSRPPTEPEILIESDRITMIPGAAGFGIDPAALADALHGLPLADFDPISIELEREIISSNISDDAARTFAERWNAATGKALLVRADDTPRTLSGSTLRSLLSVEAVEGEFRASLDPDETMAELVSMFPDVGRPIVAAEIDVEGDSLVITDAVPGTQCCADSAVERIEATLDAGESEVSIDLVELTDEVSEAAWAAQGITEEIGRFTSTHAPNESRVTNIHRIADLTQGAIIDPGGSFSVNDFVGKRTTENGFVGAGVIFKGEFHEDVGGGISQYVTTLFNAAFFGGLDIPEYRSHSIYISRYPRGREATISFPEPDLVISNPTEHAVMIWPTYTESSITIQLFSTKVYDTRQVSQRDVPNGECTKVITTRERTELATGESEQTEFVANYRPAEGLNCQGEDSNPEGELPTPTPTTTAQPATTAPPTTQAPATTTSRPATPTTAPPTVTTTASPTTTAPTTTTTASVTTTTATTAPTTTAVPTTTATQAPPPTTTTSPTAPTTTAP